MIGFIGGGNIAEAIIKGMPSKYTTDIMVSEPRDERRVYLERTYRIKTTPYNKEVASACNVIILAVKPQDMDAVTAEIADTVTSDKTVVSVAAGITISYLLSRLKTPKIVRVMPNVAVLIQEGMSAMSMCGCIHDKEIGLIKDIFMSVGKLLMVQEKDIDAVTALSGSGPALFAYFVETMIEGGTKMGLSREDATTLTVQTLLGTAKLLDTGMTPQKLREMVTSPKGVTAAALKVFEERELKGTVISAIESATKRAKELAKGV